MAEIVPAFGGGEEGQRRTDGVPELRHGAPPRGAEQRFQLGEPQFDRIQIGTIGRQIPELRAGRFDPLADPLDLRRRQIVHHDDVADLERRAEDLIHVGEQALAIHRAIEEGGRGQPGHAQRRHERTRLPVVMRGVIVDAGAPPTPAVATQQVGGDPAFIQKDEPPRVNRRRDASPVRPGRGDVRPILFGGAYRVF